MSKKRIKMVDSATLRDKVSEYLEDKKMMGVKAKTLDTYACKLHAVLKDYEDMDISVIDWKSVITASYDRGDIADYSRYSYMVQLKSFIKWLGLEIQLPSNKAPQTIKNPYTDEEIRKLIAQPKKASYTEYGSWCCVLLLVDTGIRASSLRNIKREDVDLNNNTVNLRHTKTGKVQVLPFSNTTRNALKTLFKACESEYAITDAYGNKMSENCLRLRIERYNKSRGVNKTSIHLFRHYFAKSYLLNGGNAIMLQKYLGHNDIRMSAHYADIYSADLLNSYVSQVERVQRKQIKIT